MVGLEDVLDICSTLNLGEYVQDESAHVTIELRNQTSQPEADHIVYVQSPGLQLPLEKMVKVGLGGLTTF